MNNKINLDKEFGNIDLKDLEQIKKEAENTELEETNISNTNESNTTESDLLSELSKYADEATEKLKNQELERKKQAELDKSKKEQTKYVIIGTILAVLLCFVFIFSGISKKGKKHRRTPVNQTRGHKEFSSSSTNNNYFQGSQSQGAGPMGPTQSGFENNPM